MLLKSRADDVLLRSSLDAGDKLVTRQVASEGPFRSEVVVGN